MSSQHVVYAGVRRSCFIAQARMSPASRELAINTVPRPYPAINAIQRTHERAPVRNLIFFKIELMLVQGIRRQVHEHDTRLGQHETRLKDGTLNPASAAVTKAPVLDVGRRNGKVIPREYWASCRKGLVRMKT